MRYLLFVVACLAAEIALADCLTPLPWERRERQESSSAAVQST